MKEYIYLRVSGGLLLRCCCYRPFGGQQSLPPHVSSRKTLTQFRLWGKSAANFEGINPKGLKNSLEKALTYAHITEGLEMPLMCLCFVPVFCACVLCLCFVLLEK